MMLLRALEPVRIGAKPPNPPKVVRAPAVCEDTWVNRMSREFGEKVEVRLELD